MGSEDRGVHLFVLIHGLWGEPPPPPPFPRAFATQSRVLTRLGGPGHLQAAKEELIRHWQAQRGGQSSSVKTSVDESGDGDDPTVTTEVEAEGPRQRSGRLRAKENGLSYAEAAKHATQEGSGNNAGDPPSTNSHALREKDKDESTAPDDLVVVIAGGMSSTLTYDGIDVNASRVAWEVNIIASSMAASG